MRTLAGVALVQPMRKKTDGPDKQESAPEETETHWAAFRHVFQFCIQAGSYSDVLILFRFD